MISIEDYEVMTETLETISEPETLAALLDWQQNPAQQTFTVDEVRDALAKRLGGNA
jgi:PHD/YefM family antitoxin component YafN of YafNO toxin-antitoxin module